MSEYRIESGLNCGGHAFATEGDLLGPILEVFKARRSELICELHELFCVALTERGVRPPTSPLKISVTVQGGIGTTQEDRFLIDHYNVDGTGWGSPFLLVPEATNVDEETRKKLALARKEDFYLSDVSPLGVPFNNLRDTTSEQLIKQRVLDGKSGSPCTKKFLIGNTEFTKEPICTASTQYQRLKIRQLKDMGLAPDELERTTGKLIEKSCLCEDLAASAVINSGMNGSSSHAVAVCPGPNLAYFSKIVSLEEMVGHIYGRIQLITATDRPNMFINELRLYIDYLKRETPARFDTITAREQKRFDTFKANLQDGITYYKSLVPKLVQETERYRQTMWNQLLELEQELMDIVVPAVPAFVQT